MRLSDDRIIHILWDEELNIFYDIDGQVIVNVMEYVTPNDLYLFRQDHGVCLFPHRTIRNLWCEIITDY